MKYLDVSALGNMEACNKTGHGKIDQKNCFSCTRENKLDKKLVKKKLLVCAFLRDIKIIISPRLPSPAVAAIVPGYEAYIELNQTYEFDYVSS
jgi:hypothetical protein